MSRPATQSEPAPTGASAPVRARARFPAWLLAVLLGLVTMALYWPVTGYDFVNFDDGSYVYQNAHVQRGLNWHSLEWAFTNLDIGLWHPLTWVSHMLDCQWFGPRPGGHHLTSLLLHVANTMLLLVVLGRMTGARWRSALVAALFGLHPLHVESVAWVAERKDVLSTFFVMWTLWAYARYAEGRRQKSGVRIQNPESRIQNPESGDTHHASRITHHASRYYLLSLLFFACGLMSKPMVITLPLLLLLLDYWPLKRWEPAGFVARPGRAARLLLEKLPFVLAALLTSVITLHAGTRSASLASVAQYPIAARLANATLSYAGYLVQAFWPHDLAVFYPLPATFSAWSVAGAALLLLGISVAAFCLARRWPYVMVGWLWYLATLLPVIGLIQVAGYSHADRYTYVSLIGVFVALVWGAYDVTQRWRYGGVARSVAGAAALVLCLVLARQQLGHWKDSEALFRRALEVTEKNYLAHNCLGSALAKKGQTDEAIRQYEEGLRLKPDDAFTHNNLGTALCRQGRLDEGIRQYEEAFRLKPDYAFAHFNLGNAFQRTGRLDDAIQAYQAGLKLQPDEAEAQNTLATLLAGKGRLEEAIGHFQQALSVKPDFAEAHNNLGITLARQGRRGEAIRQFQEALRLKPDYAAARKNLDAVLAASAESSQQPGASPKP